MRGFEIIFSAIIAIVAIIDIWFALKDGKAEKKKNMKKRLLFLFVIVMLFTLVSCNKQKEEVEAINWEAEYYELQANIVIETYEEYFEVIKENVLLKAEIEYLKEYIENIINYEVLKEEQYWTEQYLETFLTIFENANKELIKYGLYLGYDGKIYVKE